MYPDDLKYTAEHEWVRTPGEAEGSVRVGITHYAQDALGDIVYVSLPEVGDRSRPAAPAASWSRRSRSATSTPRSPARWSPATRPSTPPPSWSTATRTAAAGSSRSCRPTPAARRPAGRRGVRGLARAADASSGARRCALRARASADRFGANHQPQPRAEGSPRAGSDARPAGRIPMPFCTACGKQNPDDARFCSQCGTRLVTPSRRPPSRRRRRPTATITLRGAGASGRDLVDRQLNPVDAAAVDALPAGHALLVVQRGPGAGSRFLLDKDVVTAGRHPDSEIFLDDVTVSRRHAEFRRGRSGVHRRRRRQPQRHLRQPRPDRHGRAEDGDEVQIGKYRLVFFAGHEEPDDAEAIESAESRGLGRRAARMNIGEVLDRLRPDFPGVTIPKIRFLEDKGLVKPERTPSGLPQVLRRRLERLRYVLRMQRDHYLPLKVIGEHLDAIDRGLEPPPIDAGRPDRADGGAGRRRAAQPPSRSPPRPRCGSRARSCSRSPRSPRSCSTSSSSTAWSRRARHRPLRHRRARRSPRPRASWPTSASSRATCGPSRPPPTARSGWSSRSSRRTSAAATPPPRPAPRRPSPRSRRCRCGCTRPWSRPACAAPERGARRSTHRRPRAGSPDRE